MQTGDKVEVVAYDTAYYWKRDLLGKTGVVDEVSTNAVAVRFDLLKVNGHAPVWLCEDCVQVI